MVLAEGSSRRALPTPDNGGARQALCATSIAGHRQVAVGPGRACALHPRLRLQRAAETVAFVLNRHANRAAQCTLSGAKQILITR